MIAAPRREELIADTDVIPLHDRVDWTFAEADKGDVDAPTPTLGSAEERPRSATAATRHNQPRPCLRWRAKGERRKISALTRVPPTPPIVGDLIKVPTEMRPTSVVGSRTVPLGRGLTHQCYGSLLAATRAREVRVPTSCLA
jgi:hypothetical protein